MPTIPKTALERLGTVKRLRSLARATFEGLRDELDHAREEHEKQALHFAIATRDRGGIKLGTDGFAYFVKSERTTQTGPDGRKTILFSPVRERANQYSPLAAQVHRAKVKLDQIREQQSAAAMRSAELKQAVQEAEQLLRELGWRPEV